MKPPTLVPNLPIGMSVETFHRLELGMSFLSARSVAIVSDLDVYHSLIANRGS